MKPSKKERLACLLMDCGGIRLVNCINRLLRKKLLVLAYHRICDMDISESDFKSDIELVSASADQFDWQMNYLKKNYSVVTFREYDGLSLRKKLTRDFVVITFDDGFKDNYDVAFPILKKHSLPAVFYISTDYIGTKERFWFEYLVSVIQQVPGDLLAETCKIIGVANSNSRREISDAALAHFKFISNSERLQKLKKLNFFAISKNFMGEPDNHPMSWENIQEMHNSGMEIGSHTLSHPILTNLDESDSRVEIENSKIRIDDILKTECVSISYPNGQRGEFDSTVIDQVKSSNYKYACSYISGTNSHNGTNRYELRRIHVERYTTNNYFAASLALPSIFC